jgi:hypothetical protein
VKMSVREMRFDLLPKVADVRGLSRCQLVR